MGGVVGKRGNGIARFIRWNKWRLRNVERIFSRVIWINKLYMAMIYFILFLWKRILYRGKWENNVKRVIYKYLDAHTQIRLED